MKKLIPVLISLVLFFSVFTAEAYVKQVGRSEITIYGGVSTKDNVEIKTIFYRDRHIREWTISIESGGGDVTAGIAIYNTLREQIKVGKKITTSVQSAASSMAAIIFLAGTERVVYEGSQLMFHKAYHATRMGVKIKPKPGSDSEKSLKIINDFFVKLLEPILKDQDVDKMLEDTMRIKAYDAYKSGIATKYIDLTKDNS